MSKVVPITKMLVDPKTGMDKKVITLTTLINSQQPEGQEALRVILAAAAQNAGAQQVSEDLLAKKAFIEETVQKLMGGPAVMGTFIKWSVDKRAFVKLYSGDVALCIVMEDDIAKSLQPGDDVVIDKSGTMVFLKGHGSCDVGNEAKFLKKVDDERIEVSFSGNDNTNIINASKSVMDGIKDGTVKPGQNLIVNASQLFAFYAVPTDDQLSHYQFLCKESIPDVIAERDIGSPMGWLNDVAEHLEREMLNPELGRKYRLRRSIMKMLTGVSGSGKTLHIQAVWHQMYELMAKVVGCQVKDLPFRVLKLRSASILSKWVGESDKQLDRFFDEIEQLASERFTWEGTEYSLPVLVIMEEAEGLSRSRGEDSVYDRIQTTMLQRLDTTVSKQLKDELICFFSTSNVPQLIDPAFLRRAGGTIEHFSRLQRDGFQAVLSKHIQGLPLIKGMNEPSMIEAVTNAIYPVADIPICKLKYREGGDSNRFRKDFLTGAIIDRAVQQGCDIAVRGEHAGTRKGISPDDVIDSINSQVKSLVKQLAVGNAINYLDIPDGMHVSDVQKMI